MAKRKQPDISSFCGAKKQVDEQSKKNSTLHSIVKLSICTGSDRSIDDQSGETTSASNLRIHVEGTISSNVSTREKSHSVEFDVRVGENAAAVPYIDKNKKEVPGIVSFHKDKDRLIRCEYCRQFPHIVKQHVAKQPAITTIQGTRFYARTLTDHLETPYHKECTKYHRISLTEEKESSPMLVAINQANKLQINHVGKLTIQVYVDAKRLNLTPYSWPARYIAGESSFSYDCMNENQNIIGSNIDLQYVNRPGHLNRMSTILKSDRANFIQKINECLALSLRIDGSIDFTQIDKIYVMGKLINIDGSSELVLIGVAQQNQRFVDGLMAAVMDALKINMDDSKVILQKTSSIVTDGTNLNSGDKGGSWKAFQDEAIAAGCKIPLNKIWCAAHRSELAWKSTAKEVTQINDLFSVLSTMSSYFRTSALRTAELKAIATDLKIRLLQLPKIFEIRWTEFTFKLIRNVLVSWNALVIYFKRNENDAVCAGYLKYLTNVNNIKLIAFVADLLFVFSRLQKQFQSDKLTIILMKSHIDATISSFNDMKNVKIPGGFESNLAKQLVYEDFEEEDEQGQMQKINKVFLKSIELHDDRPSRRPTVNIDDVRVCILTVLCNFLDERFQTDEMFLQKINPFINFDRNTNVEEIHSLLAPDVLLPNLYMQFNDFSAENTMKDLSLNEIILKLSKTADSRNTYKELIIVLARIAACTPHSADVERMIQANNRLKIKLRSSMSIETENKYLYIHTNMPTLSQWNPTTAAKMFVDEKDRRHRNINPEKEVSRRQPVFQGVFSEANECKVKEHDENDDDAGADETDDSGNTIFEF